MNYRSMKRQAHSGGPGHNALALPLALIHRSERKNRSSPRMEQRLHRQAEQMTRAAKEITETVKDFGTAVERLAELQRPGWLPEKSFDHDGKAAYVAINDPSGGTVAYIP